MSFQKEHSHKYQVLRCDCGTHFIELTYYPEDENEKTEVFLVVEITQMGLWWRIKWAVNFILNRTNDVQEFYIGNEYDFIRFKKFVDEIYEEFVNNKGIKNKSITTTNNDNKTMHINGFKLKFKEPITQ